MAPFREQWPWNPEFRRLLLLMPSAFGIAMAAASYPSAGPHALWFLTAIPVSLLLRSLYGAVGRRVEELKQRFANDPGEVAEGLIVLGRMQSPGLVVLREDALLLVPIMGKAGSIPLPELRVLKEGRTLPGKFVWGKRAFILEPQSGVRVAFAVGDTIGRRWSRVFAQFAQTAEAAQQGATT